LNGGKTVIECTFVENDLTPAPFFSTPVTLGSGGVSEVHSFGALSDVEQANFDAMIPDLIAQAQKGIDFVKAN
jgi:malate dehydrogenase